MHDMKNIKKNPHVYVFTELWVSLELGLNKSFLEKLVCFGSKGTNCLPKRHHLVVKGCPLLQIICQVNPDHILTA